MEEVRGGGGACLHLCTFSFSFLCGVEGWECLCVWVYNLILTNLWAQTPLR